MTDGRDADATALPGLALRGLPAVGKLVTHPQLAPLAGAIGPAGLRWAIREAIQAERARRLTGLLPQAEQDLVDDALRRIDSLLRPRLRPVINATGVVINTNLGRSPLPPAAVAQLTAVAAGYCNLEMELDSGQRGSRHSHIASLATHLTGAEAALVVNNCAAAVLLLTDTFARGREVVVSRGQLIEIGGSFRLPEVLEASGARLREVGTTNKTYLSDYARAIGPETGMLLISHTSNYRILGFTAEVERASLAALARETGVVAAEDLGSGLLVDLTRFGLPPEPTVQQSLAAGLDLVVVSTDKLMGGPQAGLVLGRAELVARMRANPLMRALRPDKLALAALEATLRQYLQPDEALRTIPTLSMIARPPEELARMAQRLAAQLSQLSGLDVQVVPGHSAVGGGTLPGVELPTELVAVRAHERALDQLARALRLGEPSVVARIAEERLLLDPRTLAWSDFEPLVMAFQRVLV
ncbi:MAG: L-seryl-tRNA(Sec) selenium transferase [Candidatus Sericytochromatia bacterium]|nr:L-seryl-tRNA(Sec) selenium transferase [Candidatus Sericytochromatia bacterium]